MLKLTGSVVGLSIRVITTCLALSLFGGCVGGGLPGLPGRPQDVSRTIALDIAGNSLGVQSIAVKPGETVRFLVRNESKLPHDFTIGAPFMQKHRRAIIKRNLEASVPGSGYHDRYKYDSYNAVLVPPGQTKELIWWFTGSQNLKFGCNLPGHDEAGMRGSFEFDGTSRELRVASAQPVEKPTPPPAKKPPTPAEKPTPPANKHPPASAEEEEPITAAP